MTVRMTTEQWREWNRDWPDSTKSNRIALLYIYTNTYNIQIVRYRIPIISAQHTVLNNVYNVIADISASDIQMRYDTTLYVGCSFFFDVKKGKKTKRNVERNVQENVTFVYHL